MKLAIVCVLLAVFGAVFANEVTVLTSDNFESSIADGVWFIKFYAPWCGHCKRLAPTWDELAETVGDNWNVAKIDCTENQEICSSNEVRGYPTLKLFENGQVHSKYQGARTIDAFVKYVEENIPDAPRTAGQKAEKAEKPAAAIEKPAAEEKSESDVVDLNEGNFDQARKGVWLVEFFAPWCGHCKNLAPTWEELGTAAKGKFNVAKVDVTQERGLAEEFGIKSMPTIKLLQDGEITPYQGPRTLDAFVSFVEKNVGSGDDEPAADAGEVQKDEGVLVLTDTNFAGATEGKDVFVEFYAPWCGHCKRLAPTWAQFAQDHPEYNIAKVDCTVQTELKTNNGIRGFPTLKLFKADGTVVQYSGARTAEAFEDFLNENL